MPGEDKWMEYDVIIVGGGAAGCMAAALLGAAEPKKHILLLEKAPRVGKKLLATGNGTCNITNIHATPRHYHGAGALAQAVLEAFTPRETMAYFTSIGVDMTLREDGKVYPLSSQAGAVLDALRLEAAAYGVETRCDCAVRELLPGKNNWRVLTEQGTFTAQQVLVCTGGAAAPSLGVSGESYSLLTALDCEKTPLFPSIVQLRTDTSFVRAVKGLRVDAKAWLTLEGKTVAENTGEVLFTEYGLSGPAIMQISRPAGDWERRKRGELVAHLSLLPDWSPEALEKRIWQRSRLPRRTLEDLLTGLLHKRVGQTVLRVAKVLPLTRSADSLTPAECHRIAVTMQDWTFAVTGTQGFGGAQVTAGGIAGHQIAPGTMALKGRQGLYVAGEVLDVDGDCGGFNLQFAWSSAYVAAKAIAARWGITLAKPEDTLC